MKTIGLLGGMSWESTAEYYRLLNEGVRERLGGLRSARLVLASVDFGPIAEAMHDGRWSDVASTLAGEAVRLERAGAEVLLVTSNSMHKVADAVSGAVAIPLLHIVDVTGDAIAARGFRTIGLLGTRFTMEDGFFSERLERRFGVASLVPDAADRAMVHRVIFDELCLGVVKAESRAAYAEVIAKLAARGAEAVVLGCTEIAMLVSQDDASVPLLDTTRLHCEAALASALQAEDAPRALGRAV